MLQTKAVQAVKLSTVISVGAAVGLANIMKPTNAMLFENADGSAVLAVLSGAIFFSSLIMVSAGVLQGLGHVFAPAKYILVGLILKAVANYFLVPSIGLMGAALSTIIGLTVITLLMLNKLNKKVAIAAVFSKMIKRLFLAAVVMTVALQLWMYLFSLAGTGRLWSTILALTGVMMGGAVYLIVILDTQILSEEEMAILPYSRKLNYFNRKRERRL